eukprot:m.10074 g.10074  ORF g.10074 m.10074 type:complete len:324 (-) comp9578_c0_seq2:306-1277(-)
MSHPQQPLLSTSLLKRIDHLESEMPPKKARHMTLEECKGIAIPIKSLDQEFPSLLKLDEIMPGWYHQPSTVSGLECSPDPAQISLLVDNRDKLASEAYFNPNTDIKPEVNPMGRAEVPIQGTAIAVSVAKVRAPKYGKTQRRRKPRTKDTRSVQSVEEFYSVSHDGGNGSMFIQALAEGAPSAERKVAMHIACLFPQGSPFGERLPKHRELFQQEWEVVVKFLNRYDATVTSYTNAFRGQEGGNRAEPGSRTASMALWRQWPIELKVFTVGAVGKLTQYLEQAVGKQKDQAAIQKALRALKQLVTIGDRWRKTHHKQGGRAKA